MDFNFSKCMQTANYFGHTDYHNVCNGIVHTVNWGTMDYIVNTGAVAAIAGVVALGALLVTVLVKDFIDAYC